MHDGSLHTIMASRKRNNVIEEFIEMYKSEHCLWRIKCKDYRNKYKKAAAYEKLVVKLREMEPDATRNDVMKKINNMRCNVRKERKKYEQSLELDSTNVPKPSLWYYELFDFLKNQNTSDSSSSTDDENDSVINSEDIGKDENDHTDNVTEDDLNYVYIPTNDSTHQEQQLQSKDTEDQLIINDDKLVNEVLDSVKNHFKRPALEEDRYDLLGKTVAIKLRTLGKRQRLIAEKIINDALFEAEMGNLNYDSHQMTRVTYKSSPNPSPNSSSGIE